MGILKGKKSQLGSIQGIIATLIIVCILIASGFFILQEFLEQDELSDTSSSVTNETGLFLNQTPTIVAKASEPGFRSFSITTCYANATGTGDGAPDIAVNTSLHSGNWTTNADEGTIISATGGGENYTDVACTYSYLYGEQAYVGLNETLNAMGTFPDLLGLIILISIIGIVLLIVFNVIPGAKVSTA